MTTNILISYLKRRHVGKGLAIICLILGGILILWIRVYYGSLNAYQRGEALLVEKQYIRAITYFDRSMHWYTPFSPYVQESAERLWEIGEYSEQVGDTKLALIAYRTIRRSYHAASHIVTPGKDWIAKCDAKISFLSGNSGKRQDPLPVERIEVGNKKGTSPDVFWSVVVEVGFLGWIGCTIALILFVFRDTKGSKSFSSQIMMWGGFTTLFFVLWIIGMTKA